MKITGAIFDFDGTLFDSMHLWKNIRQEFFDRLGIVLTDEDKNDFKGLMLRESLILAKDKFELKHSDEELFNSFFQLIEEKYLADSKPKNDIVEFLEKLKSKNVKMCIATATGESALKTVLKKFNLLDYFTSIYSTYTVGAAKTEPTVYRVAHDSIGTDKNTTWVFEDALYAAKTAKADGFNLVGIYDESEKNTDKLKEIADIYIHNYNELNIE